MQHIILTRNQYFRNRNAWGFLILNLKSGMYFTVTALAMFPVLQTTLDSSDLHNSYSKDHSRKEAMDSNQTLKVKGMG